MKLTLIHLIIFLFTSQILWSQSNFDKRIDEIKSNILKKPLEKSLSQLDQLRVDHKKELKECGATVRLNRAYALVYYKHWKDEKTLQLNTDSILPLLLMCKELDPNLLPQTYFNIGNQHKWFNQIDSTNHYYQKCIEAEKKLSEPGPFSGRHYLGIGEFFRQQGDLDKALVYQNKASQLIGKSNQKDLQLNYKYLARIYEDKGEYQKQEKSLLNAKIIIEKLYPAKDHQDYTNLYEELGSVYHYLEEYDTAINYFRQSIDLLEKNIPDYAGKLTDLNRKKQQLAMVLRDKGMIDESLTVLNELKKSYSNPKNKFPLEYIEYLSSSYEDIGDSYFASKDYILALNEYHGAVKLIVKDLESDALRNPHIENNQISNKDFLRRLLGLKSKALYAQGLEKKDDAYLLSAIDAIQKYDTLVRMKLNQDFEEGSHQTLFEQSKEYYKYGILAAKELYAMNSTLENANYLYGFISKLKSQLLYRNIQQEEKQEKELTEDQLVKKDTLEKKVSEKQLAIQTAEFNNDEAAYKTAINDYFDLKLEQESFLRELGLEDVLDVSDFIETASIEEIQKKLNKNTAILEYYLVDEKIIQVTIRKDDYKIDQADFDASSLINLYGELSTGKNVATNSSMDILNKMVGNSIPPTGIENLIIIPDEELLQFPFEILELDGQRLINKYNISYEYSSAFLFDESGKAAGENFIGFASDYSNPQFNNLHENYTYSTTGIRLSPLDNAADEIELSKASLGGSIFINESATKEKFTAEAASSSILHLAMHGVLHTRIPDLSALVFESDEEDFLLTASEIYNLDIPTNLTVLSACNSGVGPIQTGDGVRSLTRSFIHAGSESVITSLWEASDASTSQILTSFYKFLKEGKSKSESLRLAKLEYLDGASPTYQHPKYWAHLVLVGNTAPIFGSSLGKLTFWIIAAAALLFILVLLLRKVASNKST